MTGHPEQRRGQRFASAMWVRLSSSGSEIGMGHLVNVSVCGAFLETRIQLPVHAGIRLEAVSSARAAFEDARFDARVVRIDPRGLGIEWRAMLTAKVLALLTEPAPPPVADDGEFASSS